MYDNTYHVLIPSHNVASAFTIREAAYPVSRAWVCRWCGESFAHVVSFCAQAGGHREPFAKLEIGDCPACGARRSGMGATSILRSYHWRHALQHLPEGWLRYELDCAIDSPRAEREWLEKVRKHHEQHNPTTD